MSRRTYRTYRTKEVRSAAARKAAVSRWRKDSHRLWISWHLIIRGLDPSSGIVDMDRKHEPYARIYDSAFDHPKFRQVGALGWAFYWKCVNYARRNLKVNVKDGFVPTHVFINFFEDVSATEARKLSVRMMKARLLEPCKGGFLIHDWPEHENTKAELERLSETNRANVNQRRDRNPNPTNRSTDGSDQITNRFTKRESLSLSHSLSVLSEEDQPREVDIDPGWRERPEVVAAKQWSRDRLNENRERSEISADDIRKLGEETLR